MKSDNVIITNSSLNAMLKPNNRNDNFTMSVGLNNDAGVRVNSGTINHHKAMIFDFVYDHMYRMFNQTPNSEYINTSLKYTLQSDESIRKTYYKNMLNDEKMKFFNKVNDLLNFEGSIPFNKSLQNYFLNTVPDIIDNAFPLEFSLPYRNYLETKCESDGNFDFIIELFKSFDIHKYFFAYLFSQIFYGKQPSWSNTLNIDLNSIFNNNERTTYVLKNWFLNMAELNLGMSYPITCFSSQYSTEQYFPKNLKKQTYMHVMPDVQPFHDVKFNKPNMEIIINLRNSFMVLFAHDAKMCVRTFVPSKLYEMDNNSFFIGKGMITHVYYDSRKKSYRHKETYKIKELFELLNMPINDANNNNNSYRKKAIIKSIGRLHDHNIINVSKLNSEQVILNSVWNITDKNCNLPII